MHFLRREKEELFREETRDETYGMKQFPVEEQNKIIKREKGHRRSHKMITPMPLLLGIRFKKVSNSVNIAIQSLNHTLKIIQQR